MCSIITIQFLCFYISVGWCQTKHRKVIFLFQLLFLNYYYSKSSEKTDINASDIINDTPTLLWHLICLYLLLQEQLVSVEGDKASLSAHIDSLKGELLIKSTELVEMEHQYKELQAKFSEAGHKHAKDLQNVAVQVSQLEAQVISSQ